MASTARHPAPVAPIAGPLVIPEAVAAKALSLSVRSLQRLRTDGGGPAFVRLGARRVGYTSDALSEWLASRTRRTTAERAGQ